MLRRAKFRRAVSARSRRDAPRIPGYLRKRDGIDVRRGALLQVVVVGVELQRALEQDRLGLGPIGIGEAALDRADGLTRFMIVEADALGAEIGVDDVDIVPFADGIVRASGSHAPQLMQSDVMYVAIWTLLLLDRAGLCRVLPPSCQRKVRGF